MPTKIDDLIVKSRKPLEDELKRLQPYVEAHERVQSILDGFDGTSSTKPAPRRGTTATAPRAGRGTRAKEFMGLVKKNPGITVADAAKEMEGMNPNYLYRIAREQTEAGGLEKRGSGYFIAGSYDETPDDDANASDEVQE